MTLACQYRHGAGSREGQRGDAGAQESRKAVGRARPLTPEAFRVVAGRRPSVTCASRGKLNDDALRAERECPPGGDANGARRRGMAASSRVPSVEVLMLLGWRALHDCAESRGVCQRKPGRLTLAPIFRRRYSSRMAGGSTAQGPESSHDAAEDLRRRPTASPRHHLDLRLTPGHPRRDQWRSHRIEHDARRACAGMTN